MWNRCKEFLKPVLKAKEYLTLVIAALVFIGIPYIYRLLDPTAGAYDLGVLQIIALAVVQYFSYNFTSWFTVNLFWPDIRCFFNDGFSDAFKSLTGWQKIQLSVFLVCFFMLMLVLLSRPA